MNMFARFDENPAMTLRVIKETKRYGRTDGRTHGRTHGQRENSIPPTNKVCGGYNEWTHVKNLVVQEGYHRDKMSSLWGLICKNYKQQFPNLVHLAALAVTAPIHTSDCERGFSAQNQVKTALRNRISSERVDDLLIVKIKGEDLKNFDFLAALQHWRTNKQSKLFLSSESK